MHIADPATGNLGANAIVCGSAGIATGAAYASKYLKNGRVAVCFFGEGALGQGILYEEMNLAQLWKLPVIFVCENNSYNEYTHFKEATAGDVAFLHVRMPFREATALVTVEREGVAEAFVKKLSGRAPWVAVPIRDAPAPNVFVSVLAVRGRADEPQPTALVDLARPALRLGMTKLRVGWRGAPAWLPFVLYLVMGWLCVVALAPLVRALPPPAIGWLFAGGLLYTVGVVVLTTQRPRLWPGRFDSHDLWHVFVLAGSACHFVMMLRFVALSG